MREKSVFLSDLEKSKEFFTEIRIAALSPRRISASDRPDIEARCGRQQPQHYGVRTGQRRAVAARGTGHGSAKKQKRARAARFCEKPIPRFQRAAATSPGSAAEVMRAGGVPEACATERAYVAS